MTKTNEGRIKELDFVHTEWGDTVHVADVVTLLIEKDKEREEAVKEERERIFDSFNPTKLNGTVVYNVEEVRRILNNERE